MKGSGYRSVLSVILAVIVTYAYAQSQSEERCIPADNGYDFLSCDFEKDFCRWKNAEDNTFDWKGDHEAFDIFDDHATAESNEAGSTARLESPWLCATGTYFTSLKFDYYMGHDRGRCRLSVQIKTELNTVNIVTKTSHEGRGYETVGPEYITCPDNKFKIVFEAEKLISGKCGSTTEGIDIDDVVVLVEQDKPSPGQVHTCSVLPTTTQPLDTSASVREKNNSSEPVTSGSATQSLVPELPTTADAGGDGGGGGGGGGLSGGGLAGVIVAGVVAVAVIVAVVILFLRTRQGGASSKASRVTSEENVQSSEVTNLVYCPDEVSDAVFGGSSEAEATYTNTATLSDNAAAKPKSYTGAEVYEIVSDPHPGDVYHILDEVNNRSDVTSAARHGSTSHARDVGRGKGDDQDEYNALLFESVRVNIDCAGPGNVYDSTGGSDTYNALSRGSQETALPASTTSDYDHV